jgi:hypothetical protein
MPVAAILLLCSLPIPVLAAVYWHWKVHGLYKRLGDQVRDVGYYWFSTQFQTPGLATQFYRCKDFASFLPEASLAEIAVARREARLAIIAITLWMMIAVVLFCISGRSTVT